MSIFSIIERKIKEEIERLDESFNSKPDSLKEGIGFMLYSLNCIFKSQDFNDIEEGIVDSGYRNETHDYGIDAIYVTANNEIITSPDELESYNKDTKFCIHIMQFKKSTGIDQTALLKLKEGINETFINKNILEQHNTYMFNLMNSIYETRDYLYENFSSNQIKIKIYVCFTGVKSNVTDDSILAPQLISIKQLLKDNAYSNVDILIIGAQELLEFERKTEEIKDVISYRKTFKYITEADENEKLNGYICVVDAMEIGNLVKKWQSSLFEANIRDYYKNNDNNAKILGTCSSQTEGKYFWSFNNGLTITCSKLEELPNDKYRIHGLQIVNGCQTSNAIYESLRNLERYDELNNKNELSKTEKIEMENIKDKKLNNSATILVKIVETQNPELIYRITEATNSQTAIQVFTLKANEDIHKNIEQYFKEYEIYYERRVNYYKNQGISPRKIIDIKKLAQLYLSIIKLKPSQARSKPKTMFLNEYDEIFPSKDVKQFNYKLYLIPVLVHLKVEKAVRSLQRNKQGIDDYKLALLANGKFHIDCFLLSSILKRDYTERGIIENSDDIMRILNNDEFNFHLDQAIENLRKVVQNFAGMKKEAVPSALRKSDLDGRILRTIKSR